MNLDRKRWVVIIAAICANLCQGSAYVFSVYAAPLEKHLGAPQPQVSLAFSLSLGFLPLGMLMAGRYADRGSPRLMVLLGGTLFSLGMFLAGFTNSLTWLYLTYGLMMSLGNGAAYGAAVSAAVRWFPDKRGMASGLVVSALGLGALIIAPIAQWSISQIGILHTFKALGIVFLFVVIVASRLINNPPAGYAPANASSGDGVNVVCRSNLNWRAMIAQPVFYQLFVLYLFGTFSGLMVMSRASGIAQELAGMSPALASVTVGLLGAANSAGRLAWGAVSDKIGRFRALALMFTLTAIMMIGLASVITDPVLFVPAILLVGLCYGGYLGVFPSVCADAFGSVNLAVNYAVLFTAFSLAGLVGPQVVTLLRTTMDAYAPAFWIAAGICAVGLVMSLRTRIDWERVRKSSLKRRPMP